MCNQHRIGTIRQFKTQQFTVIVDAVEETDLDLSFDVTGDVHKGLRNGDYIAFVARARVYYAGAELAADYLGGCIYRNLAEFMDHKECGKQTREWAARGESGRCGSYFTYMVRAVCKEAREEIRKMQSVRVRG